MSKPRLKGEPNVNENEELLEAAKREFSGETDITPTGPFLALSPVT